MRHDFLFKESIADRTRSKTVGASGNHSPDSKGEKTYFFSGNSSLSLQVTTITPTPVFIFAGLIPQNV